MVIALLAVLVGPALVAPTPASEPGSFPGWFSVELVIDSVLSHCELELSVESDGRGFERAHCRSDERKSPAGVKEQLSNQDILLLRQLLREANLLQGQFWGTDGRGVDGVFATLTVDDRQTTAVLVCMKNESFDTGSRERLLKWLLARVEAKQRALQK